ncbi:MAG TPA: Uma2 family endonuclease [Verrucomicrobiota bacterium]|nr:Uma2 family endonuclease [Verrucomicrobiota bacterium]
MRHRQVNSNANTSWQRTSRSRRELLKPSQAADWPSIPDLCSYPAGTLATELTDDEDVATTPPALVIEILSPKQNLQPLVDKVRQYLSHGVKSCWVIIPTSETVMVFPASGGSRRFIEGDVEDPVLDLKVPVRMIFA